MSDFDETLNEEELNIITLTDEDGTDKDFEFLDLIDLDDKEYVVLLPVESEDENGKLVLDISSNADKKAMYNSLCQLVRSGDVEKALADNLHSFAGITDGYWKDLEPEGKKYMIISMPRETTFDLLGIEMKNSPAVT